MPYFYSMILTSPQQLTSIPQRIVSLVPSQSELLFDLGLEKQIIGITKFCIHPEHLKKQTSIVGGTKNLNLNIISNLQPDLIIANKEENERSQIEALANDYPVWVSDINNLDSALQMILEVGQLTGKTTQAETIENNIRQAFQNLSTNNQKLTPPTSTNRLNTVYLIWKDPYMAVGGDTFIHDMLTRAGFNNVYGHLSRYPIIDIEELKQLNIGTLMLSSEPYPFKEKHILELQEQLPNTMIKLVDGEMFSWYGSRMLLAVEYIEKIIQENFSTWLNFTH